MQKGGLKKWRDGAEGKYQNNRNKLNYIKYMWTKTHQLKMKIIIVELKKEKTTFIIRVT